MCTEWPASGDRSSTTHGFQPVDTIETATLQITGTLPQWLRGTYVVNGPAVFETEHRRLRHWFDGLGMLHRFQFGSETVSYRRRFVESGVYRHVREHGTLGHRSFGTPSNSGCLRRARSLLTSPPLTDNASGAVGTLAGRHVAMTASTTPIEFDPATLATLGPVEYADDLSGQCSCGHPQSDPVAGETLNFLTHIARQSSYTVYRLDGLERVPLATIAVDRPCYMHSFALTPTFVVLVEFPYALNPFAYRVSDRPFIDQFRWDPDRGTRCLVFERTTGRLVAQPRTNAFFALHHVNAFERPGAVVIDLVAYPDPTVVDSLTLESLCSTRSSVPTGRLRRLRLGTADWEVSSRTLSSVPIERPQVAERRCATRPYRYVYGVGCSAKGDSCWYDRLVKLGTNGSVDRWRRPDTHPGEPEFVNDPSSDAEDAGVVLSLVLDRAKNRSFLLVLDGESFRERARIPLDRPIPYPRHGRYYEDV